MEKSQMPSLFCKCSHLGYLFPPKLCVSFLAPNKMEMVLQGLQVSRQGRDLHRVTITG